MATTQSGRKLENLSRTLTLGCIMELLMFGMEHDLVVAAALEDGTADGPLLKIAPVCDASTALPVGNGI